MLSEFVGESESCVRAIFAVARALSPSVVFLDEIDAIASAREGMNGLRGVSSGAGDAAGASARVLAALLTEMDGSGSLNQCES